MITDKLGRKRYYRDGKQIKNPNAETESPRLPGSKDDDQARAKKPDDQLQKPPRSIDSETYKSLVVQPKDIDSPVFKEITSDPETVRIAAQFHSEFEDLFNVSMQANATELEYQNNAKSYLDAKSAYKNAVESGSAPEEEVASLKADMEAKRKKSKIWKSARDEAAAAKKKIGEQGRKRLMELLAASNEQPLKLAPDTSRIYLVSKKNQQSIENVNQFFQAVVSAPESVGSYLLTNDAAKGSRAYYGPWDGGNVVFSKRGFANEIDETLVHELGHHLEHKKPGAADLSIQFLEYRLAGEQQVSLKEKFPQMNFSINETGAKDQFEKVFGQMSAYYAGQRYKSNILPTELLSMGFEQLYKNPARMAIKDPEMFLFLLHQVRRKT